MVAFLSFTCYGFASKKNLGTTGILIKEQFIPFIGDAKLKNPFIINKKNTPYNFTKYRCFLLAASPYTSSSATTSFTSGIRRFIIPSIPALSVMVLLGHPEQEPWSMSVTTPFSNFLNCMAPPSISTAGFT